MGFKVTVKDTDSTRVLISKGYECFQPAGSAVAFDTVPPDLAAQVTVQSGPPGPSNYQLAQQDGFTGSLADYLLSIHGSINSPVPNDVVLLKTLALATMVIAPSDTAYPLMWAGANGTAFFGVDAQGGGHWLCPFSVQGPLAAPRVDLGGSNLIIGDDTAINANMPWSIGGQSADGLPRAVLWVDAAGNTYVENNLYARKGLSGPLQVGAVVDSEGWSYYVDRDGNGLLQIFQNYGAITNQLTFGSTTSSWAPQLSADGSYVCFMSDRSGSVAPYRMNLGGSEQVPLSFNPDVSLQNDISILPVAGQSLAGGAASAGTVTNDPYAHGLMLQGGAMQMGAYGDGNPTSLVPLREMNLSGSGDETPCSSMSNQFAYLCLLYKGFVPTIASQSSAAGGHTLDTLFTGDWYPKMTAAFPKFQSLAAAIGRSAYPRAIGFVHGESDGNQPAAGNMNYAAQLKAYYLKWIQDIGTASGTFTAPPLFLTQTSSEYGYSNHAQNVISPQQLAACLNNPGRFYFAGPEYMMQQTYDTQNVHLLALGYQWLGQLLGTAMFRALVLKQRYTGLMPKLATKVGSTIFVTMRVPRPLGVSASPALVIDTTNIPAYGLTGGMYGFEVRNAADALVPINAVTLVPDAEGNLTIVKIVCASDPGAGGKVGYANTFAATTGASQVGPSGNLRTLWGVPALYPTIQADSTHGDLFDWCAHFKIAYTS